MASNTTKKTTFFNSQCSPDDIFMDSEDSMLDDVENRGADVMKSDEGVDLIDAPDTVYNDNNRERRRHQTEPSEKKRGSQRASEYELSRSVDDISEFRTRAAGKAFDQSDGEDEVDGVDGFSLTQTVKKAGRRLSIPFLSKSKEKIKGSSENVSDVQVSGSAGGIHKSKTFTSRFDRFKFTSRSFSRKSKSSAELQSLVKPLSFTDKIYKYPARIIGVFLLIANFTADLKGYNRDRVELRKFFEEQLGYIFIERMNRTKAQVFQAIDDARNVIKEEHQRGKKINRLIVTILTHGGEDGLHTCKYDIGQFKERDDDGKLMVTDMEDIIAKVKHDDDNLPELKCHPKLFFIQACYGEEIVRSAGGQGSNMMDCADGEDEGDGLIYQPTLPVDADLFVAMASSKYNKAFVSDDGGSWFIQSMLAVFRKLYKSTDVESMFKAVTFDVSEIRKPVTHNDRDAIAAQVPTRQSTLRKDCFL